LVSEGVRRFYCVLSGRACGRASNHLAEMCTLPYSSDLSGAE
jgi:hypothetical protein